MNTEQGKEPKERHKWERKGHPYHHEKICVKCGCIKDTTTFTAKYILNGETFFEAPNCNPLQQSK